MWCETKSDDSPSSTIAGKEGDPEGYRQDIGWFLVGRFALDDAESLHLRKGMKDMDWINGQAVDDAINSESTPISASSIFRTDSRLVDAAPSFLTACFDNHSSCDQPGQKRKKGREKKRASESSRS